MKKPYTFSGHDTFAVRHGWLKKVHDRALKLSAKKNAAEKSDGSSVEDFDLFDPESAMAAFGVGKNMVRSMRYWSLASRFIEVSLSDKRKYQTTSLANLLLSGNVRGEENTGLDPYFENPATTWVLHWEIVTNREKCTAWYVVFSEFSQQYFTKEQLIEFILEFVTEDEEKPPSKNSILKDVNCLIQMYCSEPGGNGRDFKEEAVDCPVADLRLISRDPSTGVYRFEVGEKKSLPPNVLYYAIAKYSEDCKKRLISLDEIFYNPGSPGQIFKLDETSMCAILETADRDTNGLIEWQETGPLRQIRIKQNINPLDFLGAAYSNKIRKKVA